MKTIVGLLATASILSTLAIATAAPASAGYNFRCITSLLSGKR